jgi:hypothetical protein
VRLSAKRRLVVTLALIGQIFAGVAIHVSPVHADERAPLPAKHLQTIRDATIVRGAQKAPCPEHAAAQIADQTAKSDANKQACCKDGTCKCPAAATPAAVETRAVAAPVACPAPRADGICEAPPSRLRPSVFFRPPI